MAPLRLVLAGCAMALSVPCRADSLADWQPYVAQASLRFGIPVGWITRVMRLESNGQILLNGQPIRSRVGAMGLMQLMPRTWDAMRALLNLGGNPDDPRDNILAGAAYLRLMYDRFGYPGLFAAYNAGPARYSLSIVTGKALPAETQTYLRAASTGMGEAMKAMRMTARNPLFIMVDAAANRPASMLFVVRHDDPDGEVAHDREGGGSSR